VGRGCCCRARQLQGRGHRVRRRPLRSSVGHLLPGVEFWDCRLNGIGIPLRSGRGHALVVSGKAVGVTAVRDKTVVLLFVGGASVAVVAVSAEVFVVAVVEGRTAVILRVRKQAAVIVLLTKAVQIVKIGVRVRVEGSWKTSDPAAYPPGLRYAAVAIVNHKVRRYKVTAVIGVRFEQLEHWLRYCRTSESM